MQGIIRNIRVAFGIGGGGAVLVGFAISRVRKGGYSCYLESKEEGAGAEVTRLSQK